MKIGHRNPGKKSFCFGKEPVRFPGKTDKNIGTNRCRGIILFDVPDKILIMTGEIAAPHVLQDFITPALQRDVEVIAEPL
jgi:hypothetical protein